MGIVGKQQGVSLNHFRNVTADTGLGQALFPQVLIGNTRQLCDFGGYEAAGR